MHGAPDGPVSSSLILDDGAPIFPNIGRETCVFVDNGILKTRWSSVQGNKWDSSTETWPDEEARSCEISPMRQSGVERDDHDPVREDVRRFPEYKTDLWFSKLRRWCLTGSSVSFSDRAHVALVEDLSL